MLRAPAHLPASPVQVAAIRKSGPPLGHQVGPHNQTNTTRIKARLLRRTANGAQLPLWPVHVSHQSTPALRSPLRPSPWPLRPPRPTQPRRGPPPEGARSQALLRQRRRTTTRRRRPRPLGAPRTPRSLLSCTASSSRPRRRSYGLHSQLGRRRRPRLRLWSRSSPPISARSATPPTWATSTSPATASLPSYRPPRSPSCLKSTRPRAWSRISARSASPRRRGESRM